VVAVLLDAEVGHGLAGGGDRHAGGKSEKDSILGGSG
jgi:hypothetical protein